MALTPTMAQTEKRVRDLITSGVATGQKDAVIRYLQNELAELTMRGDVGNGDYLIIAGELQTLKKAPPPEPNYRSVISDLLPAPLTPTPPMMPQGVAQGVPQGVAPEDAGGLAAMEAPNMEGVATMAGGGLVAFADGGEVPRFQNTGLVQGPSVGVSLPDVLRTLTMDERRFYQQTGQLPPRAQAMLTGQAPMPAAPTPGMGKAGTGPATISMGGPDVPQVPLPENMSFYPGTAGLIQGPQATRQLPSGIEAVLAQAERGEGPNVSRNTTINPNIPLPGRAPVVKDEKEKEEAPGGLDSIAKAQGMDYATAEKQAREMMGKDLAAIGDPLADIKEELKGASEKRKKDLEQNAWMRASQAFFGIATGDKNAIVQGIKDYGNDIKESDKISREDRKLLADIKRLETADKRDNVFKTADLSLKILGEANAQQRAELAARTQLQVANIGKTTAEAGRAEARDDRLLLQAQELASKQVRDDMRLNMAPAAQKDAEIRRLTAAYYNQLMELRGGKGAQAPTGTTLRFDAKGNPIR